MTFSKARVGYLIGMVVFAFWFSLQYYNRGLEEASLMANVTGIFSNLIFVGVLLMGFLVFLLRKSRRLV